MGFYNLCLAGGSFMLVGVYEVLVTSYTLLNLSSLSPLSPPRQITSTSGATTINRRSKNLFSISFVFIATALLSFFFLANSLISSFNALQANDQVGFALQLQVLAVIFFFFVYSIVGILTYFTDFMPLPSSILSLIAIFAFVQEFLLFYLQRKDPFGIENRYFDLLLVPIAICIFSTILELGFSKSNFPSLARGCGLILQGTWFVQMGFSFYTNLMTHGCALHEKSRGNYTVKCKGHPEYHRGRAIATLQFNIHLAFLVVLFVVVYNLVVQKHGAHSDYTNYKPLNEELRQLDHQYQFSLDSDDDDDSHEIKEEYNVVKQVPGSGVNGFSGH